ncbi:uncharacterized protein LOC125663752 [Ostrea edulis]|uniref:uncharacterized protein LOC125663752 n=1 Tax=Ostrea edulis TaxID=37623 RepID=UPI0024AF437C|nr:uncharacterized protein LOC125663752 [Ostrea edulis]
MGGMWSAVFVVLVGFVCYLLLDHTNQLKQMTEEITRLRQENHNLKIHEYILNDLKSQVHSQKEDNGQLRKDIDRLYQQRDVMKDTMGSLKEDVRRRDEALKEFDTGVKLMHEEFKEMVKEIEKLVGRVAIMDEQMEKMNREYGTIVSDLNDLRSELNRDRNHYHKHDHNYSGGGMILNSIRYAISVISNKLLGFAFGGISSIFLLN